MYPHGAATGGVTNAETKARRGMSTDPKVGTSNGPGAVISRSISLGVGEAGLVKTTVASTENDAGTGETMDGGPWLRSDPRIGPAHGQVFLDFFKIDFRQFEFFRRFSKLISINQI